jgi:3-hydroxyacyl-[acyl-carrier-protein] dehydratase
MIKRPDYAAPLVAIDQVLEVDEQGIRTAKVIAGNEPFFVGHYPEYPIFPGVFILEAVHQATREYTTQQLGTSVRARVAQVRSIRFLSPLRPGDRLEITCRCTLAPDRSELLVDADCQRVETTPVPVALIKLRYVLEETDAGP